jgi:hypothetical protein
MASLNSADIFRSLSSFKQWAQEESIVLIKEDKLSEAKELIGCVERVKELEAIVGRLSGHHSQNREDMLLEISDSPQGVYPKYFLRGQFLVKHGLNREKSDVYEQKVSRVEFLRIIEALQRISLRGREFEVQDVLSEIKLPNYKIYLVLGAMQSLSLIQIPRKGAYSFVDTRAFQAEGASTWQKFSGNSE